MSKRSKPRARPAKPRARPAKPPVMKLVVGPKILTIDIETAPIGAHVWSLWDQNVGLNQITQEWTIISFAAKWLHDDAIIGAHTGGRGVENVHDDRELLLQIRELLDEADIVVNQNGVSFDMKKINARMLMHGILPYSPVRQIDTKRIAKRHFGFTSNKLEWMASHIAGIPKSKHDKFPGFELWTECLKDNSAAWKELMDYNGKDVRATEALYLKMLPWIEQHPNIPGYFHKVGETRCPKCASTSLENRGFVTTQYGKYQRRRCNNCGGWSRDRTNLLSKEERVDLLSN